MDRWMDKKDVVYFIYMMENYSAIQKQNLANCTTWTGLKDIMLSEISQPEKDKYHMISLICGIYQNKQNKMKTDS